MNRKEITDQAKHLVLDYGPNRVLEFGSELLADCIHIPAEHHDAVLAEAVVQAKRVFKFLGYVSAWGE